MKGDEDVDKTNNFNVPNLAKKGITIIAIIFILLWFSDILPPKVAEVVAAIYMNVQEDGSEYDLVSSEYSPAHDCYFVYFENRDSSTQRHVGIYWRFFPFDVYYDSNYPG